MVIILIVRETRNLSTIDEIVSKCDVFDGSVVNGIREPILFFKFR